MKFLTFGMTTFIARKTKLRRKQAGAIFVQKKKIILDLKVFQLLFEETSKHRLRYNCGRRNVIIKELFRITILPRNKYHIDQLFRITILPRRKYHIVRYFAFLVELVSTSERPIFFDLFSNDCISLPVKFKRTYLCILLDKS